MTGSDDLDRLRAAYRAAVDAQRGIALADEQLRTLRHEEVEARMQLDARQQDAELEQQEADMWAGKGFRMALWAIFGQLEQRRGRETAEALAAAARFAAARTRLDHLMTRIAEVSASRPQWLDAEAALVALRAGLVADPTAAQRVAVLEQAAAEANAQLREHDEAITALDRAAEDATVALDRLSSARTMGAWDIMGGGIIASAIKRERVREAVEAIGRTGVALERLRTELADVPVTVTLPPGLEIGSTAWTFDVWWDNIFSDLNMQSRIKDTEMQVQQVADALAGVRHTLMAARQAAAADAARAHQAVQAELGGT